MMGKNQIILIFSLLLVQTPAVSQASHFHLNAHAHNDYKHPRPLINALQNGFTSVEADLHLKKGKLVLAHIRAGAQSPLLEKLYLIPLDSILQKRGFIYEGADPFLVMIDIKTDGEETFRSLQKLLSSYKRLLCAPERCPIKIFLSGNRPIATIMKEGYQGIAIDGRPDDVGKGFSADMMPVISDHYKNWCGWNGRSELKPKYLYRIQELAKRVHTEGKKLRLWAIPDNERAWEALLNAGVDLINTDKLEKLNSFLMKKGL